MPNYKRSGDGRRVKIGRSGEATRPGCWYSKNILVGDKQVKSPYAETYHNGWPVEKTAHQQYRDAKR